MVSLNTPEPGVVLKAQRMNYQQTLDYLFSRLPMFSRIGAAAMKPDLANTRILCNHLGNPANKFQSIHIAGTNGKGSTSHMLAAILQSAGYKTGLYTSPHLKDFRERIRVNGGMIPQDFVITFTQKIRPVIEEIDPSFFELTVAMAFDYFAQEQVDIAVIEVGLGGRLDSTNVITPVLSVITNIGFDHMNLLGNTLPAIAVEKAGIIKRHIPVVIGETNAQTAEVFMDIASKQNAPIEFADQLIDAIVTGRAPRSLEVQATVRSTGATNDYVLDMPGSYQTKNLATVITAVNRLRNVGWNIPSTAVATGLSNVRKLTGLHGRWEQVAESPAIILDVAHNEDGIRELVRQLSYEKFTSLHIVLGMVKDKEIERVLSLLPLNARYYFTKAQIPRALDEEELQAKAEKAGLQGISFPGVDEALDAARAAASSNDLILVCGSVFLVGEVEI